MGDKINCGLGVIINFKQRLSPGSVLLFAVIMVIFFILEARLGFVVNSLQSAQVGHRFLKTGRGHHYFQRGEIKRLMKSWPHQ